MSVVELEKLRLGVATRMGLPLGLRAHLWAPCTRRSSVGLGSGLVLVDPEIEVTPKADTGAEPKAHGAIARV